MTKAHILTLPMQRLLGRRWLIGLNIIGNAVMFGVPSLSNNPWLVGAAGLLGSIGGPMWTIAAHSLLGRKVPSSLLGRVSAAYSFLGNGIAASGPLLGGLLAKRLAYKLPSHSAPPAPFSCSSLSSSLSQRRP
ncbi:hypothetical protein KSD_75350 [Ktedonobacter sp. SOSP1-85]|uniref:hypothetical protein n=1 Tax=Ktedonobacter sp. SOSP1-85 TaxID=2778367 RepID=UPI001914EADC|nr:hypothetical protein [Ktedonobacter sp. SOSP1-85]GHO79764.1 hypothetical protein KSD_75350 [Ktedonobacter sp. SOSP1-85]